MISIAARSTLLLALGCNVPVLAQEVDPKRMEAFAASLFDRMDLNNDGVLSAQEYEHTQGGGFKVDYALLDLNDDGTVSKREYLLAVRKYHVPHSAKPI